MLLSLSDLVRFWKENGGWKADFSFSSMVDNIIRRTLEYVAIDTFYITFNIGVFSFFYYQGGDSQLITCRNTCTVKMGRTSREEGMGTTLVPLWEMINS